jgi:hypothetical protein
MNNGRYGLVTEQKKLGYTYRSNLGREQVEVASRPIIKDEVRADGSVAPPV